MKATPQTSVFEQLMESPSNRQQFEQEKLLMDVSELVTRIMDEQGVNRVQLAETLGRSKAFVSQLLSGNQNLTLRTLSDLFFALDHQVSLTPIPIRLSCLQEACLKNAKWQFGEVFAPIDSAEPEKARHERYMKTSDSKILMMIEAAA